MADINAVLSLPRTDAEEPYHGSDHVDLLHRLDSSSADCSGVTSGASDAGRSNSLTSGEPDSRSHSCSTISADPVPDTTPAPAQPLPRSSGSRRRNRRSGASAQPAKPTAAAAAADPHHSTPPCDAAQHPLLGPESYDHAAAAALDAESPGRADYCTLPSPGVSAVTPPAFAATPRSVQRRQRGFGGGGNGPAGDQEVLVDLAGEGDVMRATAAVAAALLPPSTLPVRIVVARAHPREAGSPTSLDPTQPREGYVPAPGGGRPMTSKSQHVDGGDAAAEGGGGDDDAVGPDTGVNGAEDELTQMATAAAAAAAAAAVAKASTISVVRSRAGAGGRAGEGSPRSPGAGGPNGNDADFGALPHSPGAGGPSGAGYCSEVHGNRQQQQHHHAAAKAAAAAAGVDGGGAADGGGGGGGKGCSTTTATRRRLLRTAGMLQVAVHPREDLGHVYCTAPPTHQPLPSLEPVTLGAPVTGVRGHSHAATTTSSGLLAASPGGAPPPSPGTPGNGAVVSPGSGRRGGSGRPPRSPRPTGADMNGVVNSPGHGIAGSGGGGANNWRAGGGGGAAALDRAAAGQHASLLTVYGAGYTGGTGAAQMPYNIYGFMPQPPPPPPPPRRAALGSPQGTSTGYGYEAFQLSPRSPEDLYRQEEYLQQQLQQHYRDVAALSSSGMLPRTASAHGGSPSALLSAAAAAAAGGTAYRREGGRISGTGGDVVHSMPLCGRTVGAANAAGLGGGGGAATSSQGLSGVLDPAAAWGAYASELHSPELSLSALQLLTAQAGGCGAGNDLMAWSDLLASSAAAEQGVGALGASGGGFSSGGRTAASAASPMRRFSCNLSASGGATNYPSATDPWVDAVLTPEQMAILQGSSATAAVSPSALTPAATPPYSPVREGVVRPASATAVAFNPFAQRQPQGPILATAATGDPTLDVISAVNWSVGPFSAAVRSLSCAATSTSALTLAPSPDSATAAATAAATSGYCGPTAARTGGRSRSSSCGSNAAAATGGSSTSTVPGGVAANSNPHELPALGSVSYPAAPRPPLSPSVTAPPSSPGPCSAVAVAAAFLGREAQESPLLTSPSEYDMNLADVVAALAAARQLMPGMALPGCGGGAAPATAGEAIAAAMAAAAAAGKGHQLQLGPFAYLLRQ